MQPVELKRCTPADIPQLRQVALQSYHEHYLYLWTEDKYVQWYTDISFGEQSLQRQMNEPGTDFFLIQTNAENVGFLKTITNYAPDNNSPGKSLYLERIYIIKRATNQGIGAKAVQMIIDKAKEEHLETIWLKSMDSSKAVQFYEKMGFKIVKTEQIPFEGFKDEYRNIHLMILQLFN